MRRGNRWMLAAVCGVGCLTSAALWAQHPHGWGSRGTYAHVPDATGNPSPTGYITLQGGMHMHLPKHRKPPCQRPTSICIKPKVWKFSQVLYQLHHEIWHGVTDPCWLMDPDCCGNSCQHQKSFGLLRLVPWAEGRGHYGAPGGGQMPAGCGDGSCAEEAGIGELEGEEIEIAPTPAEPPVEQPQAATYRPIHSVLLRRE